MSVDTEDVRERVGVDVTADVEVARGTDTEIVSVEPDSVVYGSYTAVTPDDEDIVYTPLPMVVFQFNKYNPFLPPWECAISFTLYGDETAQFGMPRHLETRITGNLKSVYLAAATIQFE